MEQFATTLTQSLAHLPHVDVNEPRFQDETIVIRRYYSGVQRGDEIINVRDSVLLKSGTRKKDPHYVARVSGLWEEDDGKTQQFSFIVRGAKLYNHSTSQ